MPSFHPAAAGKTRAWEYAVRFLFGALVTVATGLIANAYGTGIGGLFLAFPAVLPASFTLLEQHDGSEQAAQAAAGASLGALALMAFAAIVAALGPAHSPPVVLALATATWGLTAVLLWRIVFRRG